VKFSLNWLKDYVALEAPPAEIARAITFLGFEVEQVIESGPPALAGVVVGEVLAREKHPNADKLSVCRVDVGSAGGVKTIVCGAQNYSVGDRVPVALPGAVLPGNFAIRQSSIRGQLSDGMMCSARELGMGDDAGGLLLLAGRPEAGTPINAVLPPGDTVFDVEITPNRPDCLSHLGIARELAAWFRLDLRYPGIRRPAGGPAPEGAGTSQLLSGIRVDAPGDCPLYTAQAITGVRVAPSPAWMQERLKAVGLRPVNNIVDIGNYVMLEYGQPLHAFDAHRLRGGRIVVRRAAAGETIVTLDGRERTLNEGDLVIADAVRPVVIAGIMGGEDSGVGEGTTDIVLEGAVFRRQTIRRTSRRLGLASDSSYRYERGVDPHLAVEAATRAIALILEIAGGRVAGDRLQVGGDVPWQREIVVSPDFVRERLGFDIPDGDMKAFLGALELDIARTGTAPGGGPAWTVSIPSWRYDLDRPIDLVEEILRLHGTDRIPPSRVSVPGIVSEDDPVVLFNRRATAYLVGHDFHECVNTVLRSPAEISLWVSQAALQELALENPFVADQSHLRPTLILGLLDTLKLNQSRGVAVSRLAEIGRVFVESDGWNYECAAAAFVLADDPTRRWKSRDPADFYLAKHHVEALAESAGIDLSAEKVSSVVGPYYGWQEGHTATLGHIRDGWTARFGLLNLEMVQSLGVEGKVYAGILAVLPARLSVTGTRRRHADFSLFPPALRDLALVVDADTPAGSARNALFESASSAAGAAFKVESVEVFDVYRSQELTEGRKSVAFSLVFRAPDRTLTDAEVNAVFQRIQDSVVLGRNWQIRK
jgi:phenylalanyl-tRNA synthetase beta chain